MYGCESCIIKKAEHWRNEAFELWCWRRLLRVPWTARRSNQSILKEISPEYSLEGLILKLNPNTLATWYKELTHLKRLCCWERLKAGREGDNRGWDGWMASPIQWTWVWVNSGSWWWTGGLVCCGPWGRKGSDMTDWLTELNCPITGCLNLPNTLTIVFFYEFLFLTLPWFWCTTPCSDQRLQNQEQIYCWKLICNTLD